MPQKLQEGKHAKLLEHILDIYAEVYGCSEVGKQQRIKEEFEFSHTRNVLQR